MSDEANSKRTYKREEILPWIAGFFIFILLIWLLHWLIIGRYEEYTDDAYVNGNKVQLMPQVSGTVVSINTDDTQFVVEGQTLVTLDDTDTHLAMEKAKANLADTVREVRQYYENIQKDNAELLLSKIKLDQAKLDDDRRQGLDKDHAISVEEKEHANSSLKEADANYHAASARYFAAMALVENTSLYEHPKVKLAMENFKKAYLNWRRTKIVSPVTGYVVKRSVQVGQEVGEKSILMSIVPANQMWVEANYKESQLSRLRIGQIVNYSLDAYPRAKFRGKIEGLSSGTGSSFDLLPPQNATGNWIKIVQRVPVRISLDPAELQAHPFRIGLSVRATTKTRDLSGHVLNFVSPKAPLYQTNIYQYALKDARGLVKTILEDNAPNYLLKSSPPDKTA